MQKLEVRLEDDLTGGPADETVRFGVDGRDYQIDLSARHAASFRKQVATFVARARLVTSRRGPARSAASRERSRRIRAWAERHGFEVAEHGRLPAQVIQEYDRVQSHALPAAPGRGSASSRTKRRH